MREYIYVHVHTRASTHSAQTHTYIYVHTRTDTYTDTHLHADIRTHVNEAGGTRLCHYCLFEDDKVAATAGCFQQLCTIYKFEMMGSLVYNTNICYTPAIDDHTHIDSHFRMPFNAISRRRITIMHV